MVCQPIGHEFEPWSGHFTFFFQSDYFRDMQQFMLDWCSEWPLQAWFLTLAETWAFRLENTLYKSKYFLTKCVDIITAALFLHTNVYKDAQNYI